jgi:hypothetical protein
VRGGRFDATGPFAPLRSTAPSRPHGKRLVTSQGEIRLRLCSVRETGQFARLGLLPTKNKTRGAKGERLTVDGITLALAGVVLGAILSWLISRHYFRASLTRREISWRYRTTQIATTNADYADRVTTHFDGEQLNAPVAVRLYLWNSGNIIVEKEAIPAVSPMIIEVKGGRIVDYTIDKVINSANNIVLSNVSETEIGIAFDYLDPDEGVRIEIIADQQDDALTLGLNGSIKDKGRIHRAKRAIRPTPGAWKDRSIHILSALVFTALAFAAAYNTWNSFNFVRPSTYSDILATLVLMLVSILIIGTIKMGPRDPDERLLPLGLADKPTRMLPVDFSMIDFDDPD